MRLQNGQVGERISEMWFLNNGWYMTRSQPPITILEMITPGMCSALKRFIPRLASFGHMVIARMGKGGVADYTGYCLPKATIEGVKGEFTLNIAEYRACEVKESAGDTMPASRLSKEQREFMSRLPEGTAWVGIFWTDTQKFTMHPFKDKGSYHRSHGMGN